MRTKKPQLAERILDAAARLFSCQRFHAVRMDDLAAEAEVSKGTLYSYFHDKNELYHDLLVRASRDMVAALHKAAEGDDAPRDRLIRITAAILDYFDAKPHLLDLIQRVELLTDNEVDFPWQDARDVSTRLVQNLFDEARRVGEFVMPDPELAEMLLFGGLRAIIRFGTQPRDPNLAKRVVDAILHGASVPVTCHKGTEL